MNSQRPAALADMFNIMAVRAGAVHAGFDCAAPCSRRLRRAPSPRWVRLRGSLLAPLTALAVATLGSIARLLARAAYGARRRHAKVSRVPPVQPQPVLAPLTPAAIFLVVTINEGGGAT